MVRSDETGWLMSTVTLASLTKPVSPVGVVWEWTESNPLGWPSTLWGRPGPFRRRCGRGRARHFVRGQQEDGAARDAGFPRVPDTVEVAVLEYYAGDHRQQHPRLEGFDAIGRLAFAWILTPTAQRHLQTADRLLHPLLPLDDMELQPHQPPVLAQM